MADSNDILIAEVRRLTTEVAAQTVAVSVLVERVDNHMKNTADHADECDSERDELARRVSSMEHFRTRILGIAAAAGFVFSIIGVFAKDAFNFVFGHA